MTKKAGRFDLDWWVVQKRLIYIIIGVLALCGATGGAGLYVWKYGNPFKNVAVVNHPAGARFVSFEGDVRVIRAATRGKAVMNAGVSRPRSIPGENSIPCPAGMGSTTSPMPAR